MNYSNGRRSHANDGMTLLELLGYVAALGIFVNICMVSFVQANRLTQVGETALLHLDTIAAVQQDFTRAVHRAVSVEPALHGFTTDSEHVILRLPAAVDEPGVTRFIVFGRTDDRNDLSMTTYSLTDGALVLEKCRTYPVHFEVVKLAYDHPPGEGTRMVSLTLRIFQERRDNRSGGGATVSASLRAAEFPR